MSDGPDFGRELLVVLTRQAAAMDRAATALEALAKDQGTTAAPQRVARTYIDQGDSSPESGHGEASALRRPRQSARS